ncbi:MAG: sensor histidine kinase, partial [Anaerolineales bacterium]
PRKLLEDRIQQAQAQLTQSTQLAAIADLADGIAHHINNPLTTIIAESQILRNKIDPQTPYYDSIIAIEKAGWRVQKAVQQLLDFSRPATASFQPLSINETIDIALQIIGDKIRATGTKLTFNLAKNLPLINGNKQKIIALWINLFILVTDGIMGMDHSEIKITSQSLPHHQVQVLIQDNGNIIPKEDLAQLSTTSFFKELGGRGSGMEINICKEILRQHMGELEIESDYDHGTIFKISFMVEGIK